MISRTDSAVLLAERQRDMNYGEQYESKKLELSNSRVSEKKGWRLVNVLIILVVIILVGWVLWRGGL